MPRPIWKGVITFGMVSIPVKLFAATESKDISLHLVHKDCGSRIKQKKWCPVHERDVEQSEIVRGYEYGKDQHVLLDEEDLENLPLASKHTIELSAFITAEEIDPVFFEKSYYLEPDETGTKAHALLMRALTSKSLTAVAKIAIRNKERLCALRPQGGILMLETLFYADEVRTPRDSELPKVEVSDRELQMANSLIELLQEPFQPEQYHDEYRQALMKVIEAKLQGEEVVAAPPVASEKITDLMSALRASVEAAKKRKDEEPAEPEAEPTRGRRRKTRAA